MYQIEELPDFKVSWDRAYEYQDVPLLDYVWEVADKFLPSTEETDRGMVLAESFAPAIFCNRYFERNLTMEERYQRAVEMGMCRTSFEEYSKFQNMKYRRLDDSFKEKFLTNEDLQNTIEAYKLDVSKLWYLLLFVYDFIEDIGINTPELNRSVLEDFNCFCGNLFESTSITLRMDNKKSYIVENKDTIRIIQTALQHFVKTYNDIIHSGQDRETKIKRIKEIGLNSFITDGKPIEYLLAERDCLDISYKKWKFANMFLFFLESRKATTIPNKKVKVSKDKWMFVSRLIYTVGYDGKRYNEEYDSEGNKNRMLSNLLRRYRKEQFPSCIAKNYMMMS